MSYDNARRILKNSNARIAQSAEGIYDQNLVIVFWDGLEARRINECIDYLNNSDQSIVSGPVTFDDVLFDDDLYHLHAYYSEEDQRLYRLLMRNPVSFFEDNWSESGTKWKHTLGETYTAGQSSIVLSIPNVSPDAAITFQEESLENSYDGGIWLVGGRELTGEWYSIKREVTEDARTGLFTVRWHLSKFLNNEVGYIYKDSHSSIVTEINLIESNLSVIEEFIERTVIDDSGNWYHDKDGLGIEYDRKNGSDEVSGTFDQATNYYAINDEQFGRQVRIRSYYDEREKNWNVQFLIGITEEYSPLLETNESETSPRSSKYVKHKLSPDVEVTIERGFNLPEDVMRAANDYFSNCPDGVTRRIDIKEAGAGLFNIEAIEITTSGYIGVFAVGNERICIASNTNLKPITDADLFNGDSGLSDDASSPVSESYYLVGGVYDYDAADGEQWSTEITPDTVISPNISRGDNGLFSWTIRYQNQKTGYYGVSDPDPESTTATGNPLFEFGDPENYTVWVGRYFAEDISNGTISLIGGYEDVTHDDVSSGSPLTLPGRRKVSYTLQNERIENGKSSFDVYKTVITADIDTDDNWFFYGATESYDRQKSELLSELVDLDGQKFSGSGFYDLLSKNDRPDLDIFDTNNNGVSISELYASSSGIGVTSHPVLAKLLLCSKRRKTIARYRKYFVRRPRTSDLQKTMDDESTSIYTAWNAVKSATTNGASPDPLSVTTFDVVKLGNNMWAIEKMVVSQDSDIYRDNDAFDGFVDSDGEYMTAAMVLLLSNYSASGNTKTPFDDATKTGGLDS